MEERMPEIDLTISLGIVERSGTCCLMKIFHAEMPVKHSLDDVGGIRCLMNSISN